MVELEKRFPQVDKEILAELEKVGILDKFERIISYTGDDELISSCNDEYELDINECIITNGITNTIMEKINDGNGSCSLSYTTSIRGATYVIIVSFEKDGTYKLDLRIDFPGYTYSADIISRELKRIERLRGFRDMEYYLRSWRTSEEFILKNYDTM